MVKCTVNGIATTVLSNKSNNYLEDENNYFKTQTQLIRTHSHQTVPSELLTYLASN